MVDGGILGEELALIGEFSLGLQYSNINSMVTGQCIEGP